MELLIPTILTACVVLAVAYWFFSSRRENATSDVEDGLRRTFIPMLQQILGVSQGEAKKVFKGMLDIAEAEARQEGSDASPSGYGDVLLEKESRDNEVRAMLMKKRCEGVRDEDIRWWWNMHDLERRILVSFSDTCRLAHYMALRKEPGVPRSEAGPSVLRFHALYGDPDDATLGQGPDRALPYELKDRVDRYIQKRGAKDADRFRKELESSSSFNALVRREMSQGNV